MKNVLRILILIIVGVTSLTVFSLTRKTEYNQTVEIRKGQSISKSLKDLPVSEEFMFKLYLKFKNQGKNIKAGYYELKGEYSIISLVEVLESGKDKVYRFTIPEGYSLEQIVNKLTAEGKINKEKFYEELNNIKDFPYPVPKGNFEGYFYPETYNFSEYFEEKDIIKTILGEFLKKFPPEKYPDKEEFYKKLIMASIIEKEAVKADEKPVIASAFYNRMKKGMTLSSDATVNYLFNYSKRRIYYKDLEIDSPYNTYKNKGLPPAPIANPDIKSVEAAYNPADTDYLFFVAKGDGYHYFSRTYKEHLEFQRNNRKK
ncbi:endolytic transglycosylase MltG [Fusobacterium perfoetens]|uniref:endolytic transglycosylase MltG n=1 Tax=Fusobacterium perfoetens TaxID=852 RepID=UPI0015A2F8BA|nr:endolytic transglycosylase MltG [Fusobacterium perfoetens]MCF2625154.1 endolytic transglycosylase MltG [Fusobacterium perfoetens]